MALSDLQISQFPVRPAERLLLSIIQPTLRLFSE